MEDNCIYCNAHMGSIIRVNNAAQCSQRCTVAQGRLVSFLFSQYGVPLESDGRDGS